MKKILFLLFIFATPVFGQTYITFPKLTKGSASITFVASGDVIDTLLTGTLGGGGGTVSLSGENYLTLSGSALTAHAVDLSGTNATGILAAGRFPALTGDVTTSAGSLATVIGAGVVTNSMLAGGITNANLVNSSITLNAGASMGITTPGAMSLGSIYTIGSTSDVLQFTRLGLGAAADATATILQEQDALGGVFTPGRIVQNTTASTGGTTTQFPPDDYWYGHAWDTQGTPADSLWVGRQIFQPLTGNPSGAKFRWDFGSDLRGYTFGMTLQNGGILDVLVGGSYGIGNAVVLTGTTLGSLVVNSSLTKVGTIITGVWNGTAIANANLANSAITIAGASTSLGGSITRDAITGISSNGYLKRTGINTYTNDNSTFLTANQSITLSSDVTGSGTTAITATIASGAVSLTKMANFAANSIMGNNTGSPATPLALSISQTKTLLAIANTDVSGLGTASTHATGDFFLVSNNLSEGTASTMRTNLGLGTLATQSGTNTGDQSGANPSATVGTSAVNGSAGTFMRSDGAPAINLTMAPTWTGLHSFNAAGIATTYTNKLLLENTTASTSGATLQQSSSLGFLGHYWGTTATAADSTASFTETLIPTSAAGRAPFTLTWQAGNGGTDMNTVMTLSNAGVLTSTTFTGALSGNATTATTLQTARAINGVNFDGSGAITVAAAAGTLTGATLASGVTASSLTSFGSSPTIVTPSITTGFTIGGSAATGTIPRGNGTNFVATTATYPNTVAAGDMLAGTGTNVIGVVAATATANKMLLSAANATSVWSTPTVPNTSGTVGQYPLLLELRILIPKYSPVQQWQQTDCRLGQLFALPCMEHVLHLPVVSEYLRLIMEPAARLPMAICRFSRWAQRRHQEHQLHSRLY